MAIDWRAALVRAMGGRCQYVDPGTGKQCGETDVKKLDLHHVRTPYGEPLGRGRDRRIEVERWRRTGELPRDEEVRCERHHKVENARGNPVRRAQWELKNKTEDNKSSNAVRQYCGLAVSGGPICRGCGNGRINERNKVGCGARRQNPLCYAVKGCKTFKPGNPSLTKKAVMMLGGTVI